MATALLPPLRATMSTNQPGKCLRRAPHPGMTAWALGSLIEEGAHDSDRSGRLLLH
jgi:hypothetical protein